MQHDEIGILPNSYSIPLTPSDLAKELFFYPTWCGHYYCNANYGVKRDFFAPLLVMFVREGIFHIKYRGEHYEAHKGDVILLDCSEPHHYYAEDGLEFLYLHFDGSNSHAICQHILERTGPILQQESNVLIGQQIFEMVEFYKKGNIENMVQSASRVYRVLELLLTPDRQFMDNESPVELAIRYIRSNVGKEITLNELADVANLSPYYFAHCFKEETGFAPMEYVINTRLEQVKTQLVRTKTPIAEIAYAAGYSSTSSLNNMFVKRTGMSPREFRRTFQG